MDKQIVVLPVIFLSLLSNHISSGSEPQPQPVDRTNAGWELVWSDEFDGSEIDRRKWDFDLGTGYWLPLPNAAGGIWTTGWGNDELQCYTDRAANAYVKEGMLHIRALEEHYQGSNYTSARLKTNGNKRGLFSKTYGRFEFRAKLPVGQGLWPAFWLMPRDQKYGPWACSGEIDILEAKGQEPAKVFGTLVYGSRYPKQTWVSKEYVLPNRGSIADFHVYALEWAPGQFRWYVDGKLYAAQDFWWSCSKTSTVRKTNAQGETYVASIDGVDPASPADLNPWPAPFDQPFYIIMNLSVGGRFVGNPDASTVFPQEMIVDYVRVYEKLGGYPASGPRGPGKIPFTTDRR